MPFFKVTTKPILVEAENATEAAMAIYRMFEDCTPCAFDVVGPDTERAAVALSEHQQEDAITISFAPNSRQVG